ncbi:MAG: hypothetical protein WBA17_12660, partial [Saprospiraceae bacterium]
MKFLYLISCWLMFSGVDLSGQALINSFEVSLYGGPELTFFNIKHQVDRSIIPGLCLGIWLQ